MSDNVILRADGWWYDAQTGERIGKARLGNENVKPDDLTTVYDTTPLCLACGQPMDVVDEQEVEIEAGLAYVWEPVYQCCNPDCQEE